MMRKSNLLYILGLILVLFTSCQDDDNNKIFEEDTTTRSDERIQELTDLLQGAEYGYKVVYFTKPGTYGGFNFYMKFGEDNTVEMVSDFSEETLTPKTGLYDVRQNTTTELVFTTRNWIHKLSDNASPSALYGTGYEGHSQFQYFDYDQSTGVVKFYEIRSEATLYFIPLTQEEWANVSDLAETCLDNRNGIVYPAGEGGLFSAIPNLTITNSSGEHLFDFSMGSTTLFATATNMQDETDILEFGMAGTEEGVVVNPAIEYEGNSYEYFLYDEVQGVYISEVNGTSAILGFDTTYSSTTISQMDGGTPTWGYYTSWGYNSLTTNSFLDIIDQVNTVLSAHGGFQGIEFSLTFNGGQSNCESRMYIICGDGTSFFYCFTSAVDNENGTIHLAPTGYAGSGTTGNVYWSQLSFLRAFFTGNLTVTLNGAFQTDSSSYSNTAGTFTNEAGDATVYGLYY